MNIKNFVIGILGIFISLILFVYSAKGQGSFFKYRHWTMKNSTEKDVDIYNRMIVLSAAFAFLCMGLILSLGSFSFLSE
jgi:hypothetical protein